MRCAGWRPPRRDRFRGLWLDPKRREGDPRRVRRRLAGGEGDAGTTHPGDLRQPAEASRAPFDHADVPALGDLPISALSPELIRAWYGALRRAKGGSVAAKAYTRLRQILRQAVTTTAWPRIRAESTAAASNATPSSASPPCPSSPVGRRGSRPDLVVLTAGLAGLRRGELFALRRSDVDLLHANSHGAAEAVAPGFREVIEDVPKSAAGTAGSPFRRRSSPNWTTTSPPSPAQALTATSSPRRAGCRSRRATSATESGCPARGRRV